MMVVAAVAIAMVVVMPLQTNFQPLPASYTTSIGHPTLLYAANNLTQGSTNFPEI